MESGNFVRVWASGLQFSEWNFRAVKMKISRNDISSMGQISFPVVALARLWTRVTDAWKKEEERQCLSKYCQIQASSLNVKSADLTFFRLGGYIKVFIAD